MLDLYVVAGPNGVGKTTLFRQIIPSSIEYINADLIAKQIKEQAGGLNTQDLANAEAARFFFERVRRNESFAIETNLHDLHTYRSILALKEIGYRISVLFLSVDDVDVCIARVALRVKQGGHHVNADVIRERYINGISLLSHFKFDIDRLTIIDNTTGSLLPKLLMEKGKITFKDSLLPDWVNQILSDQEKESLNKPQSIEEARKRYEDIKRQTKK